MLLEIENLTVKVNNKKVLKNINLSIGFGETILLLGPNGSGKTSLIQTIANNPKYKVLKGRIKYMGKNILNLLPEERLKIGISIAFQFPPKIKGVTARKLLEKISEKYSLNEEWIKELAERLDVSKFLDSSLHEEMSGGESKRLELFLTLVTKPHLTLLDEPDSGIDIENLATIGSCLNDFLLEERVKPIERRSALIVTHLGEIAKHIMVDRAYVLVDGEIVCYGKAYDILKGVMENGFGHCKECLEGRK